ncbi:MAG: hypothetical protein CVU95_01360 [Firmicutes bacterium HGW-Firmicutes-2]|jgi:hypothetical protein|nr:MAG: hypothetical protein CVU95_01360 [Firmicutes bacterium HGW-Firmicutes-2]
MNFFEQELRKIFEKNNGFNRVSFIGKTCYGTLTDQTRMKLEFVTMGTHQKYEGIKATVIDKKDGVIDSLVLKFSDILGKKKLNHPNFREGMGPHIWIYNDKPEWYAYEPTTSDYRILADSVKEYAELFNEQMPEMSRGISMNQQM